MPTEDDDRVANTSDIPALSKFTERRVRAYHVFNGTLAHWLCTGVLPGRYGLPSDAVIGHIQRDHVRGGLTAFIYSSTFAKVTADEPIPGWNDPDRLYDVNAN